MYDWSTGLIYKNGKYYDPRSDLWLTFGSPAVVWAVNRLGGKPDKRKDKKQDKRFFWFFFLLLVLFVLVSCEQPPSTSTPELPTATATATATKCPTDTPIPTSVPPTPTNAPTNTPTITPSPTNTPRPTQTFTPTHTVTPQHPYKLLPSEPPDGLEYAGPEAWRGLNQIQQKQGFWGSELDEREALLLIINHELDYQVQWQIARDVIINQYKNLCDGGTWSARCINQFWGYSQQIKGNEADNNGSEREPAMDVYVANLADSLLNGTAVAQNTTLTHYGNALVDDSAQKLYQDYLNGNTKYATYVVPTYCANGPGKNPPDCKENPDGITGVWVLQTDAQHALTGTIKEWVYPTPTPTP